MINDNISDDLDAIFDELCSSFDEESSTKLKDSYGDCGFVTIYPYDKLGAWNSDFRFVDYRSRGVTYKIPELKAEPRGRIGGFLEVSIEGNPCEEVYEMRRSLYLYDNIKGSTLKLIIDDSGAFSSSDKKLLLALYKEGVPQPLKCMTCGVNDYNKVIKVDCNSEAYAFGRYFLLVCGVDIEEEGYGCLTMGSNIRFNFSLLPHGEKLEHPAVKSISLKKKCRYPSAAATLDMVLNKPQSESDEYLFYCVDDSYKIVGNYRVFSFDDRGLNRVKVDFSSRDYWVAGHYTVYALHNGEPFFQAKFYYDDNKFELIAQSVIERFSSDYMYVKYLLLGCFSKEWACLSSISGYTECKRRIISNVKSLVMNNIRESQDKCAVYSKPNYCIDTFDEDFLYAFLPLATGRTAFSAGDCNQFVEQKYTADPYEEVNEFISSCSTFVMVLKNVGALLSSAGAAVLSKVETWLEQDEKHILFLCGTPSETRMLIESSPLLQRYFPRENFVVCEQYTLAEQVHFMQTVFVEYQYLIDSDAEKRLIDLLREARNKGVSLRWRNEELRTFFLERIYPRACERVVSGGSHYSRNSLATTSYIMAEDLDVSFGDGELSTYETAMGELNQMVGLANLKEYLNVAFNSMRFDEMRRQAGLSTSAPTAHHMIFTGNPGTGKTTVAKTIGRIFHALGLLSKGDVIVTERTQLVGRYIGETERNMQRVLEQARGNVLFIDEAYTLCGSLDDRRDFGRHVIDALLTVLSQPNPDMLIILAGYKKEMDRMMLVNQGLDGRFPYKFHFEDYSEDELMQIALNLFAKHDYMLMPDAAEALRAGVKSACKNKDAHFSNARWMGQLVMDGVLPAMSSRVMCGGDITREALTQIHRSDVEKALERFGYKPSLENLSRCVGFSY